MKLKEPFVIILIGPTLSGKSTYVRSNYPDTTIISRDEIVMEVAGTRDYNKAFNEVDQKLVDKILSERLSESNSEKTSTIVDMTNMTIKRRRQTLQYFGKDFTKVAIVFPILSDDEYQMRNIDRNSKENKWIPPGVIKSMISSYQEPTVEEGFDNIIIL
jgi:predicted kinase